MNAGLSTSWFSKTGLQSEDLLDRCGELGFTRLELSYNLGEEEFNRLKSLIPRRGFSVLSLHAVCPHPRNGGECSISSEDEEERKQGVDQILETIRRADEVGAGAVVVHAGQVPIEEVLTRLKPLWDKGTLKTPEGAGIVNDLRVTRLNKRGKTFSSLLKSLDEINREAERRGIFVGLENRYHMREYPNFEEFGVIFNRFGGSRLGYWHDVRHAQVQENLGIYKHKLLLDTFSEYLIGVHLHDVQGGYHDHFQPGLGGVDFDMVKKFIPDRAIRILEIHPKVSPGEAASGMEYLRSKGIL